MHEDAVINEFESAPPPPRAVCSPRRPSRPEPPRWRTYDADQDFIREVRTVLPATSSSRDGLIVTGRGGDNKLVLYLIGRDGREYDIVVCRDGWLPLAMADTDDDPGPPARGVCVHTTKSPPAPWSIQLSHSDRRRIVSAILKHFLGPLPGDGWTPLRRQH